MRGKPGSSWWLLQHELRMFWFNSSKRRGGGGWLWLLAVGWLGLHGAAWYVLHDLPAFPAAMLPMMAVGATVLMVVVGTFMFSSGLKASVDSLFERGDVDLLLSSPLPSRSIFTVRLAGITIGVASVYLALAAPVVNAGLVTGHAAWLAIYPVILAWTAICCALAMLLTLLLVRVLGARKTRVVAQVLSAIAGAFIFLLAQAQNLLHLGSRESAAELASRFITPGSLLAPESALWSAGRAAQGQPLPLFCLVAVAVALFLFTVQFTHGFFVQGLQQAVSSARARRGDTALQQGQFERHLLEVVLRKEWRLIARDPQLLSQVLLQLLYLLPLAFVVVQSGGQAAPGVAAGLVMLSASLTASLTWIVVAAEDAPDLLQASPAAARVIRRGKLAAAIIPPLALMALPLLWSVAHALVAGMIMCFTVVAATFCSALTGSWQGRPARRGNFKARGKSNLLGVVLEMIGTLGWTGTGYVLIRAAGPGQSAYDARWAGITLSVALLTLLLAWGTRRRAG
jgi:ABC-2 type transport system permease protein